MKVALSLAFLALLFASCQKDLSTTEQMNASTVGSEALLPLKYHSTSFSTDYPAGSTQPFNFTKTLYPDTRVSRLQMTTRHSIYSTSPAWGNLGVNMYDYQFAYSTNKATFTRRVKYPGETTFTEPFKYEATINNDGYCTEIRYVGPPPGWEGAVFDSVRLTLTYSGKKLTKIWSHYTDGPDDYSATVGTWDVAYDANGNVSAITPEPDAYPASSVSYTYNLNKKGNYCYIPTQYLISQWFSLLEVMQWVPMEVNERKSVSLKYVNVDWSGGTANPKTVTIVQGQNYYNHKYDANGNLTGYTYGDNVPQKITWK